MESSNQETKMRQTQSNKTLEKEAVEKTTARTRTRKLIRNFREETYQEKLPSQRNIKKSTRRRDVIISFSVYLYRIDFYNC